MKQVFPVFLVVFFGYVGYSLIITIFTPLLLDEKGFLIASSAPGEIRILALGFLLACYPFGQFLSSPVLGALSDRFGRRSILVYSLTITTIVYLVIALGIAVNSYILVMVALLVAGLSEGNITIAQSVITDVVRKDERGKFFGYLYLSTAIAFVAGPLIGGKLAWLSYEIPFLFVALLLFVTIIWFYFGFKETHPVHRREHISYFEAFTNLKNIFTMHHIRPYFSANFLIFIGIFGFFQGFPVYAVERFKLSVTTLGMLIAWSSVPFLIVNLWLAGPFFRAFQVIWVVIVSALWIGCFFIVGLIPSAWWVMWITFFIVGLGIAICFPACSLMLSSAVSQQEQGRVLGNHLSLQFFSEALVGIIIGFFAAFFLKEALVLFGCSSIIGALLLISARGKKSLAVNGRDPLSSSISWPDSSVGRAED